MDPLADPVVKKLVAKWPRPIGLLDIFFQSSVPQFNQ